LPIADSPTPTLDLKVGRLVDAPVRPQPPDYLTIKKVNDERIAAENASKAEEAARVAEEAQRQAEAARTSYTAPARFTGTCAEWMSTAGITDTATAYTLIMRESGCRPDAVNPSSGACGIGQQLPCGKWPRQWNDAVGAMVDMQTYVFQRYGSWQNALAFHYRMNWY
jgi:hypothetical protein